MGNRALRARRAGDLVMTGGGSGDLGLQLASIADALSRCEASPSDLCLLRAYYKADTWNEKAIADEVARRLDSDTPLVLNLVPVNAPGLGDDGVSIEAVAVANRPGDPCVVVQGGDGHTRFASGIRKGRFLFTRAERTPRAMGLVEESREVMKRLGQTLARLGAGFADVVHMNRWYCAAGTKGAWEPSARAVAAFYREPGPTATAISLPIPLVGNRAIQIELMGMIGEAGDTLPKRHSWPEGHWDWPIRLPYKHGLACDGLAFVGGQVSLDERAEVIDPGRQDRQVVRSMANIERVLDDFGACGRRMLRLGVYYEIPPAGALDHPGMAALKALADKPAPVAFAGFANLSYPEMRVEVEAMAEL